MAGVKKKILAVLHDPGGTASLLPVLKSLAATSDLTVIAGPFAAMLLEKAGIGFEAVGSQLSEARAAEILSECSPNVLLSATSWSANLEQSMRNAAARAKIPSVVLVDHWRNYRLRWEGASYSIETSPDYICAIDQGMRLDMIAAGFAAERVKITGSPKFEEMSRQFLNVGNSRAENNALFLSEPNLKTSYSPEVHPIAKIALALRGEQGAALTVKLHPKESLTLELEEAVDYANSLGTLVTVGENVELPNAFLRFGKIFGFQTIALFEARAIGLSAYSFPSEQSSPGMIAAMESFGIVRVDENVDLAHLLRSYKTAGAKNIAPSLRGATASICELVGAVSR